MEVLEVYSDVDIGRCFIYELSMHIKCTVIPCPKSGATVALKRDRSGVSTAVVLAVERSVDSFS